jgi:hypothetical protein
MTGGIWRTGTMRSGPRRLATVALLGVLAFAALVVACSDEGTSDGDDAVSTRSESASGGFAVGAPGAVAVEPGFAPSAPPAPFGSSNDAFAEETKLQGSVGGPLPDGGGGDALDFLGRTIIRQGSIELTVDSVIESFDAVHRVAESAGGFVADSSIQGREAGQFAHLTLRIPAERFDTVIAELSRLGLETPHLATSSSDVTGEVADIEASLRNLRAVEVQYIDLLGRAREIGEVLQVQDRLNSTRLQIDRLEGRRQVLGRLADLSTLSVSLRPVRDELNKDDDDGGGIGDAARDAWQASLDTLESIAKVGIAVAVFSWWLLPLAAVGAFVLRRVLRTDRDRRGQGTPAPAAVSTAPTPADGEASGSVDTPSEPT